MRQVLPSHFFSQRAEQKTQFENEMRIGKNKKLSATKKLKQNIFCTAFLPCFFLPEISVLKNSITNNETKKQKIKNEKQKPKLRKNKRLNLAILKTPLENTISIPNRKRKIKKPKYFFWESGRGGFGNQSGAGGGSPLLQIKNNQLLKNNFLRVRSRKKQKNRPQGAVILFVFPVAYTQRLSPKINCKKCIFFAIKNNHKKTIA